MYPGNTGSDQVERLINACQHNDRKAQIKLYEIYSQTMYNTSLRIVQDTMLAEDVVQESFIKAFLSLSQFRREVPFSVWLRRIVINKSLDELRKRKHALIVMEENMPITESEQDNDEATSNTTSEMIQAVKNAVNQLSDGYRVIFTLFYFEGYDHDEIAQILNITASTSRSQLTRARQKIVRQLKMEIL
jgi:RNA polymerase sigma factor (sigma-70 family)